MLLVAENRVPAGQRVGGALVMAERGCSSGDARCKTMRFVCVQLNPWLGRALPIDLYAAGIEPFWVHPSAADVVQSSGSVEDRRVEREGHGFAGRVANAGDGALERSSRIVHRGYQRYAFAGGCERKECRGRN